MTRARLGERAEATRELGEYLKEHPSRPSLPFDEEWRRRIVRFAAGAVTEEEFMGLADCSEPELKRDRICDAHFYIGMRRLLEGQRAEGQTHLEQCLQAGPRDRLEVLSAAAELGRLKEGK